MRPTLRGAPRLACPACAVQRQRTPALSHQRGQPERRFRGLCRGPLAPADPGRQALQPAAPHPSLRSPCPWSMAPPPLFPAAARTPSGCAPTPPWWATAACRSAAATSLRRSARLVWPLLAHTAAVGRAVLDRSVHQILASITGGSSGRSDALAAAYRNRKLTVLAAQKGAAL